MAFTGNEVPHGMFSRTQAQHRTSWLSVFKDVPGCIFVGCHFCPHLAPLVSWLVLDDVSRTLLVCAAWTFYSSRLVALVF